MPPTCLACNFPYFIRPTKKSCTQTRGGVGTTILTLEDSIGFKCSAIDVGQNVGKGLGLTNANLEPCPYQYLTLTSELMKAQGLTKHKVVIHVNPNKLTNYTTMQGQTMITHVTSHDILLGGLILQPLGVILDF